MRRNASLNKVKIFLVISAALWVADTLRHMKQIISGPDCLQFCEVVLTHKPELVLSGMKIVGRTIYGSEAEFSREGDSWTISGVRDSGRRAFQSLRIICDGEVKTAEFNASVMLKGPFGIEKRENLKIDRDGVLLVAPNGSRVLTLHKNNITWIGDFSVILLSLSRSSVDFLILGGVVAMAYSVWRLTELQGDCAERGENSNEVLPHGLSRVDAIPAAFLVISFTWLGWVGWPGLHWDSWAYSPPVLSVASGDGWLGVFPRDEVLNGRGYDGHGFLHVILFGGIMHCDTWEKLFCGIGLLNGFTAATWYVMSALMLSRFGSSARFQSFLIGVMAGVVGVSIQGRPEITVTPVTVLFGLSQVGRKSDTKTSILGGVSAGLAFISSPSNGIIAGLAIMLLWMSQGKRGVGLLAWTGICGVIALIVASTVAFYFAPFSLLAWISNVKSHTEVANDFSTHLFRFSLTGSDFLGISSISPFWNVFVLLNAFLVLSIVIRLKRWLELLVISVVLMYLWPKLTDYSYLPWFPLLSCSVPVCLRRFITRLKSMKHMKHMRTVASVFLSLYTVVFLQVHFEAYEFLMYCRPASVVRAEIWDFMKSRRSGELTALGDAGVLWSAERSLINLSARHRFLTILEPHYSDKSWSENDRRLFDHRGKPCEFIVKSRGYAANAGRMNFDQMKLFEVFETTGECRVCWFLNRLRVIGYEVSVYEVEDHLK